MVYNILYNNEFRGKIFCNWQQQEQLQCAHNKIIKYKLYNNVFSISGVYIL